MSRNGVRRSGQQSGPLEGTAGRAASEILTRAQSTAGAEVLFRRGEQARPAEGQRGWSFWHGIRRRLLLASIPTERSVQAAQARRPSPVDARASRRHCDDADGTRGAPDRRRLHRLLLALRDRRPSAAPRTSRAAWHRRRYFRGPPLHIIRLVGPEPWPSSSTPRKSLSQ
jgi:hypothetical protein